MKSWINGFLTAILIAVLFGVFSQQQTSAQDKPVVNYNHIVPFSTAGGLTAFFDQSNGMVYLYDADLKTCVMTAQLSEPGASLKRIK